MNFSTRPVVLILLLLLLSTVAAALASAAALSTLGAAAAAAAGAAPARPGKKPAAVSLRRSTLATDSSAAESTATTTTTTTSCDPHLMYDAYLTLVYDDMVSYPTVAAQCQSPLVESRFDATRQEAAKTYFADQFGLDFRNGQQPAGVELVPGSFEGYRLLGAATRDLRFVNQPIIAVRADMLSVIVTAESGVTLSSGVQVAKGSRAAFGTYSFVFVNNGSSVPELQDIHFESTNFVTPFPDRSTNINFRLSSPQFGQGVSNGAFVFPMFDAMYGQYRVGMREVLTFPEFIDRETAAGSRSGLDGQCQSILDQ